MLVKLKISKKFYRKINCNNAVIWNIL